MSRSYRKKNYAESLTRRAEAELELRRRQQAETSAIWTPQAGPQAEAYDSPADVIGYGGGAGGGKSALGLGFAATKHRRSIIFRRVFPSLRGLIEDSRQLLIRPGDRYNDGIHIWRTTD